MDELLSFITGKGGKKQDQASKKSEKRARKKGQVKAAQKPTDGGNISDDLPDLMFSEGEGDEDFDSKRPKIEAAPPRKAPSIPTSAPTPATSSAPPLVSVAKKATLTSKKDALDDLPDLVSDDEWEDDPNQDEDEDLAAAAPATAGKKKKAKKKKKGKSKAEPGDGNASDEGTEEQEKLEKETGERELAERERMEKERAEKERMEKEKKELEKQERLEREQLERDRKEKEKHEKAEKAEKERLEKERLRQEKAEKERLEREEREQEEAERTQREKDEKKRAKEQRRLERAQEQERLEREERERQEAEETAERERQEQEAGKGRGKVKGKEKEQEVEEEAEDDEQQSSKSKKKKKKAAAVGVASGSGSAPAGGFPIFETLPENRRLQVVSQVKVPFTPEEECPVCLISITADTDFSAKTNLPAVKLSCGCVYKFHKPCVEAWFAKKDVNQCPMCAKEVVEFIGVQFLPPEEGVAPLKERPLSEGSSSSFSPPPGFEHVVAVPRNFAMQPYRPPQLRHEIEEHRARCKHQITFTGLVDLLIGNPPAELGLIKRAVPVAKAPYDPLSGKHQKLGSVIVQYVPVPVPTNVENQGHVANQLTLPDFLNLSLQAASFVGSPPSAHLSSPPPVTLATTSNSLFDRLAQNQAAALQLMEQTEQTTPLSDTASVAQDSANSPHSSFNWNISAREFLPVAPPSSTQGAAQSVGTKAPGAIGSTINPKSAPFVPRTPVLAGNPLLGLEPTFDLGGHLSLPAAPLRKKGLKIVNPKTGTPVVVGGKLSKAIAIVRPASNTPADSPGETAVPHDGGESDGSEVYHSAEDEPVGEEKGGPMLPPPAFDDFAFGDEKDETPAEERRLVDQAKSGSKEAFDKVRFFFSFFFCFLGDARSHFGPFLSFIVASCSPRIRRNCVRR